MKRLEREAHYSPSSRAGAILRKTLTTFNHTYSPSSVLHIYLWPAMLFNVVCAVHHIHITFH